jgi:hypothetical protein
MPAGHLEHWDYRELSDHYILWLGSKGKTGTQ